MKKVLSLLLSLCLMLSFVTFSVAAEGETAEAISINNAAATLIEVEDYAVENLDPVSSDYLSGKEGLGSTYNTSAAEAMLLASVPVTVANTGWYNLEYVATDYAAMGANAPYYSKTEFYLAPVVAEGETATETQIATTQNQNIVSVIDGYTYGGMPVKTFCDSAYLTEGSYTLLVKLSYSGGLRRGLADYISFAAKNETVSLDAATTIELEDYVQDSACVIALEGASGGKVAHRSYSTDAGLTITVPVVIEKTGRYNLEFVASDYRNESDPAGYSRVNFKLGGTALTATDSSTVAISASNLAKLSNIPTFSTFNDTAFIYAGTYDLTVDVTKNYGVYRAAADYIKFEAADAVATISTAAPATINWADYHNSTVSPSTEDSGLTYLKEDWSSNVSQATMAVAMVEIKDAGYYDIEFVSSAKANSYGSYNVMLDETTLATINDSIVLEDVSTTYPKAKAAVNNAPINKYGKTKVWLDANSKCALMAYIPEKVGGYYRAAAMYVTITASPVEKTIIATGETVIEFEDYAKGGVTEYTGASNDKVVAASWGSAGPDVNVIVDIAASGYYDIEYAVGNNKTSNYISSCEITLNDVSLGKSSNNGGTELGAYAFSSAPMTKYTNVVYLEAGSRYSLELIVTKTQDNAYKYQADYVKFSPAASKATLTADGEAQTIEFSDLAGTSVHRVANETTGNKVVQISHAEYTTISTMITVEDAGNYDIEYVAQSADSNFSSPVFKLDGVEIANAKTDEGVDVDSEYPGVAGWAGDSYTNIYKFTKAEVALTEGTHLLTVEFPRAGGSYRGIVDYITFAPSVETIDGTYFTNDEGTIKLSSDTAYSNVKAIFVTYDTNNQMVDHDVVIVSIDENGTITVAPSKVLAAGTRTAVMLWKDLTSCKPLASALIY